MINYYNILRKCFALYAESLRVRLQNTFTHFKYGKLLFTTLVNDYSRVKMQKKFIYLYKNINNA